LTLPTVSVVMPVYNAERYVAEAVESILAQTFTDFEFIIIDDGSTDASLSILQHYAKRDERIRLTSRPNTGVVRAMNEGMSQARAKYVARMDADDISLPERLAREVAFLEGNPDCVAVGCRVMMIDADGDPIRKWPVHECHEEIDRANLESFGSSIVHPTVLMRRDEVAAAGAYNIAFQYASDMDLFLRLAERGRLANLPEVLLKYRLHLGSIGHRKRLEQQRAAAAAAEAACKRRGINVPARKDPALLRPLSAGYHHATWAKWALKAGNVATARKHAFAAVRKSPFSLRSWRIAARTVRQGVRG